MDYYQCARDIEEKLQPAKLLEIMNMPTRVVIDNESRKNATVIQVDSADKPGILSEIVQVLSDLNLIITNAYGSSDGGCFMGVFNVTDQNGNKITEKGILDYIKKSLGPDACFTSSERRSVEEPPSMDHTSIELSGTDSPGLLSEELKPELCTTDRAEDPSKLGSLYDALRKWYANEKVASPEFFMKVDDEESGGGGEIARRERSVRGQSAPKEGPLDPGFLKDLSRDEWAEVAKPLIPLSASACYAGSSTFARVANGLAFVVLLVAFLLRHTAGGAATSIMVKFGALGCAAGVLATMAKDLPQEYILVPIVAFLLIAAVVARARLSP